MKTDKEINDLLDAGKHIVLTSEEKQSVKNVLLDAARRSIALEKSSSVFRWGMPAAVALASVVFVFIVTGSASQKSLPGETLYALKVNIENAISFTKMDPKERTEYEVSLMEVRFYELKALIEQDASEPEALSSIAEGISEHIEEVTDTLASSDGSDVSNEEKVELLSRLAGITKAQRVLVEIGQEGSIADEMHTAEDDVEISLDAAIAEFTEEESPAVVHEFLNEQLDVLTKQLTASTTNAQLRDDAVLDLIDVSDSLEKNDTSQALEIVLETQQDISADIYLSDE